MKATRTFLVLIVIAAAAGCSRTSSPVAPPETSGRYDVLATSSSDTVSTELRGVYTFGSGN